MSCQLRWLTPNLASAPTLASLCASSSGEASPEPRPGPERSQGLARSRPGLALLPRLKLEDAIASRAPLLDESPWPPPAALRWTPAYWPSASRLTQYVVVRAGVFWNVDRDSAAANSRRAEGGFAFSDSVHEEAAVPTADFFESEQSQYFSSSLFDADGAPASAALCTRGCMVGYTLMYDGCNPMYQARQRQTCSRSSHWCGCWPTRVGAAGLRTGPRPPLGGAASLWRHRSRPGGARAALSRRSITTRSTTSTHSCTVLASSCPCHAHAHAPCTRHAHVPRHLAVSIRAACVHCPRLRRRRPSTSSRPEWSRGGLYPTRARTCSRTSARAGPHRADRRHRRRLPRVPRPGARPPRARRCARETCLPAAVLGPPRGVRAAVRRSQRVVGSDAMLLSPTLTLALALTLSLSLTPTATLTLTLTQP